jgi:hypothetical protein
MVIIKESLQRKLQHGSDILRQMKGKPAWPLGQGRMDAIVLAETDYDLVRLKCHAY